MFNALKYSQELEKAGFTREQAEASVRLLIDVMDQSLATKTDLKELEAATRADIKDLEAATRAGCKELDFRITELANRMEFRFAQVDTRFQELEYKLTVKLGTMLTVAVGAMAALHKVL